MFNTILRVMDLLRIVRETDVYTWIVKSPQVKLSLADICIYFGIDIEHDVRNRIFWNIQLSKKVVVDEMLLDYIGYTGLTYKCKKNAFRKLLLKNTHICYEEITEDFGKKLYVVNAMDFETLLMQMRTLKIAEVRELFTLMKCITAKYCEYEKLFEEHKNKLLLVQNSKMMATMQEMNTRCEQLADLERACAQKEQYLAQLERAACAYEKYRSFGKFISKKIIVVF